jgi:hypothetical protein
MRKLCFLVALSGCSQTAIKDMPQDERPDASQLPRVDAGLEPQYPDAAVMQPKDAGPVMPPGDACAPQVTQLLKNPAFDMAPQGTGWTETLIDATSLLITDEDGVVEHTPPLKAWLGGFEAATSTVKDSLVQNVAIPMNTTALTLTGMYDVRTDEPASTTAYDTAKIEITELDGTVIATPLSLSNVTPKTAWTMLGHAFTQNLSGKTVRFRITSSNDTLDATSFFFDSLALTATHGCAPIN